MNHLANNMTKGALEHVLCPSTDIQIGRRRFLKFFEVLVFALLERIHLVAMVLVIRQCRVHLRQGQVRVDRGDNLLGHGGPRCKLKFAAR